MKVWVITEKSLGVIGIYKEKESAYMHGQDFLDCNEGLYIRIEEYEVQ